MKIIVDECLAESTIKTLIKKGFKVLRINDILYFGVEDEKIFQSGIKLLPLIH